jgi:hypothetical protein
LLLRRQRSGGSQLRDPIWKKNSSQKRAGGVVQGVCTEFKPQYCKKQIIKRKLKVIKMWISALFLHFLVLRDSFN